MQRRGQRITTSILAIAVATALLGGPATAATTTVTGDLFGNARSATATSLVLNVSEASKPLRLLSGRAVKLIVDAKSVIKRDGVAARASALQSTDAIAARVKCTFTITSASTKIACRVLRVTATAYVPPAPIQFSITAKITAIAGDALTLTNPQFTASADAASIVDPLRASSPLGIHIPTAAQVFTGTTPATFAALASGQTVTINITCAPAAPYDCRATRVEIHVAKPQSVTLVGILTLSTQNSITIDVESVVGRTDPSVNVQVLKRKQMLISVPAGTPLAIGSTSSTFGTYSGMVIGVRYTISAVCRVDVPFNCTADSIKG